MCRDHILHGRYAVAESICVKAAEQGNIDAQNWLALMYAKGKGVVQSEENAMYWRRKAAEAGNANSQYHLGRMYQTGAGGTQDYTKARHWYKKAAEQHDMNGFYGLGNLYSRGLGVEKDPVEALVWYRMAEEAGLRLAGQAADNLAEQLDEGQLSVVWKRLATMMKRQNQ